MPEAMQATVFIVDDDVLVLKSLVHLVGSMGFAVEPYDSPQVFLKTCDLERPGCLLLDLSMPVMSGFEVQQHLVSAGSLLTAVFLTGRGTISASVAAIKNGAVDFLSKPVSDGNLFVAISSAIERNRQARRERAERESIVKRFSALTEREKEVMYHLLSGKRNKQIAYELGIVEKTIKVHRARVMAKVGVTSLVSLADLARHCEINGANPGPALPDTHPKHA